MTQPGALVNFNRHCADATLGYVTAATMAYAAMLEQSVKFWSAALGVTPEEPVEEPKSWYRPPADADLAQSTRPTPAARGAASCMMPWAGMGGRPAAIPGSPQAFAAYFAEAMPMMAVAPWMMFSHPRYLQTFPAAAGFISLGVPRSVAWPAAEANAAAMDAFRTLGSAAQDIGTSMTAFGGLAQRRSFGPSAPLMALAFLLFLIPGPIQSFLLRLLQSPGGAFVS